MLYFDLFLPKIQICVGPPDEKLQHMGMDGARDFGAVRISLVLVYYK